MHSAQSQTRLAAGAGFLIYRKMPFLKDDKGTLDLVNEKMVKENRGQLFQTRVTFQKCGRLWWPRHLQGPGPFLWDTRPRHCSVSH